MRLKISCLIINLLFLSSCKDTSEPEFTWCVMANYNQMYCFDNENKETVLDIKKGLGYIMLSPEDVGILKNHHKKLHIDLDECESDGF